MTIDPTTLVKARRSTGNGECVEMRLHAEKVEVRDTKAQGSGPSLRLAPAEFAAWLDAGSPARSSPAPAA